MSEHRIERLGGQKRPAPAEWFEGNVDVEAVFVDEERGMRHGRVHFHHGAHTKWHLHLGSQILYFVDGRGMVENIDGTRFECVPGDIVHVFEGTRHRHGASHDSSAVHIAVTAGETIWDNDPRYNEE